MAGRVTTIPSLQHRYHSGSNCTLSFRHGGTRDYKVRVRKIAHGFEVIAQESQGRYDRVFYPRRASTSQFALTLELVHEEEMNDLMQYFEFFVYSMLNRNAEQGVTNLPVMTVNIPSRNFLRYGVPVTGMGFDNHVGSLVFAPTIVFETTRDPLDPEFKSEHAATFQASTDPEQTYFFPGGTQLASGQKPSATPYDEVAGVLDPVQIIDRIATGPGGSGGLVR